MTSNIVSSPKSSFFIPKVTSNDIKSSKASSTTTTTTSPQSVLNIPGTRTSLQNNQLLTPIGIPSLDAFIGGGLPVGSVVLIGQDKHNSFSDIISRCFIAEGLIHKHSIYVADPNEDIKHLIQRIPNVNKTETSPEGPDQSDELRIAWRYGQSKQNNEEFTSKTYQANYFLMNKFMNPESEVQPYIKSFETNDQDIENATNNNNNMYLYSKLGQDISRHIDELNLNITKTKKYTNILRLVIQSMGGLEWNDQTSISEKHSSDGLCKFLYHLRTVLRQSLAVCIVTVPNEIVSHQGLMQLYSHLSDYVFILDDSKTSMTRLSKTQYDGLFRINKLPSLNSLSQCFMPECLDLAFYMKKKRLIVEQLHLPPDLGENDDTQKGRTTSSVTMSCSSGGKTAAGSNKLDF